MYTNIKDLNITISKENKTKKNDFVWSFNLVLTKKARKELLTKERMRKINNLLVLMVADSSTMSRDVQDAIFLYIF